MTVNIWFSPKNYKLKKKKLMKCWTKTKLNIKTIKKIN